MNSRIPVSIAKIDTPLFPAVQWVHTSQRNAGGWGLQRGGWEGWRLTVGGSARMNPAQLAVARARTRTVPTQTSTEIANSLTAIFPLSTPGGHCAPLELATWRWLNEPRGTRG